MTVTEVDVVVVGAGAAGMACAIHAARGGAKVLLVDKDRRLGGTLHLSGGHLAAGGTPQQAALGIEDSPEAHLEDVRRISRGSAREDLVGTVTAHAPGTIAWLADAGFNFSPETPRIVYGHEPYRTARTYYGVDEGMSILTVLEAELEATQAEADLEVWLGAAVVDLVEGADGIAGVHLDRSGKDEQVRARAVVLATGGYGADPELFTEMHGAPLVSAAAKTSTGDGIHLGMSVGAALQGEGTYLPTFGGLPDPVSPGRANWNDRQRLTSERPPWEIYVDRDGKRWIAEDEESIDEKERALVGVGDQTFWTVFDDAALAQATGDLQIVVGKEPDEVRAMANTRPGVHSAATIGELAAKAGIDPAGLEAEVASYNAAVAAGVDEKFGRVHLPAPIAAGPFYAIRNHAITLVTFVGLDIDADCGVRAEDGSTISGLYAVGEVIGAGATCGNSFCSGMLLTPALTLGRLLGARLASQVAAPVTA
ncbi:FAD-dependent oxidoreductase [Nocardioides sp. zg-536]|uniref:FAD-dependent oxidoreductase n=1 Tax=Nocardioides faecalis TaxID=2803858 RepID=A0A939BXA2_9ACTN|nr:FAD-dependent oxidoreductase [Nocardioides faecalis]MBM9459148.1 FAD-dependent oxidoreductase [Nocardioides faecalis]QVI59710.1 FAD-dependent oxidoreductase [Nocardioides faecalis]